MKILPSIITHYSCMYLSRSNKKEINNVFNVYLLFLSKSDYIRNCGTELYCGVKLIRTVFLGGPQTLIVPLCYRTLIRQAMYNFVLLCLTNRQTGLIYTFSLTFICLSITAKSMSLMIHRWRLTFTCANSYAKQILQFILLKCL